MTEDRTKKNRSLAARVTTEIEKFGQSFVAAWKDDHDLRIESFLERCDFDDRKTVVEIMIALEVYLRASIGENLDPQEFHDRFPEYHLEVDQAFLQDREFSLNATESQIPHPESNGFDETQELDDIPESIGRYKVKRLLGKGGFGLVCLAWDDQLDRHVALKFARKNRFRNKQEMETLIREAQTAAKLEHPSIVAVHDVIQENDFLCIVQRFIDGRDLREEMDELQPSIRRSAELMVTICSAIAFAHQKGFVHRDLKPRNILLDFDGNPLVADFGLAIHESFQRRRRGDRSGTPRYMAPELVRGESHRIDGRTDIWSLGVMFYELLTAHRPFVGETRSELFDEIKSREPKPPRQINPKIPKELERICLKCLAKPLNERYRSATDLAEDLRFWLQQSHSSGGSEFDSMSEHFSEIVPKGLRSFDSDDADFFLSLLPGPKNRDGIPDSVRSWIQRIERPVGSSHLNVGLIYGPSGCGKSSFVKAALLPNLPNFIVPIQIDATTADTEVRLIKALRTRFPEIPTELTLPELFHSIREGYWIGTSNRILIVIDQFEQWLHNRASFNSTELVEALRHCDGDRLQCILLVRDDFWLATSRFLKALEIDLVEGQNASLVDLFDKPHARKVLRRFGQAYGCLPDKLTKQQEEFIEHAVEDLAENDRVICVRLALFAEMFKSKNWTLAELKRIGGTQGLGVAFLEDTFSSSSSPPEHRLHQEAARNVLAALLPDSSIDIRGNMRPYQELLHVSGYGTRPNAFSHLIRILDNELRLITPTDPEGIGSNIELERGASRNFYQLTHDFLVGSLRRWLNQKLQQTARGRAELRLDERCATWVRTEENRFLPPLTEYVNVRTLTKSANWSAKERRMIKIADRFYGLRFLAVAAIVLVAGLIGTNIWYGNVAQTQANRFLEAVSILDIADISESARPYRSRIESVLLEADVSNDRDKQLRRSLALSYLPDHRTALWERLASGQLSPAEVVAITRAILPETHQTQTLWASAKNVESNDEQVLLHSIALAQWATDDKQWQDIDARAAGAFMKQWERKEFDRNYIEDSIEGLRPVSDQILRGLTVHLIQWRYMEENVHDPRLLIQLYREYRTPDAINHLLAEIEQRTGQIRDSFDTELGIQSKEYFGVAQQTANLAATLAAVGELKSVLQLLIPDPDPTVQKYLIEQFKIFDTDPRLLVDAVANATNLEIRRGLLLAIGNYTGTLSSDLRNDVLQIATDEFEKKRPSRFHSASEWLLRTIGEQKTLDYLRERAFDQSSFGPDWRINEQRQTMVRITPPDGQFKMSYDRTASIDYEYEVSATEVTIQQFLEFEQDHDYSVGLTQNSSAPEPISRDCPVHSMYWSHAFEYCNWLSKMERIDKHQWCYELDPTPPKNAAQYMITKTEEKRPVLRLVDDYMQKTGYRLPTEAEWEWIGQPVSTTDDLRSRTTTNFRHHLINSIEYEWTAISHGTTGVPLQPAGRKKPGSHGLFDLHGNAYELCSDPFAGIDYDDPNNKIYDNLLIDIGSAYRDPIEFTRWFQPTKGYPGTSKLAKGPSSNGNKLQSSEEVGFLDSKGQVGIRVVRIINSQE